jgi:hypothetical protein
MTGYESKKAAARDKLEDDDTQVYQTELTKLLMESYDRGVADALEETKKALAHPAQEPWRESASDYERGVIDGMQKQMQSSVDKAVNRMAQPAQEPVAWMNPSWIDPDTRGWQSDSFESIPIEGWLPIYTTPPQRPWVGLTAEEILDLFDATNVYGSKWIEFAREIEQLLKGKNT